jgi:hypothetical protein
MVRLGANQQLRTPIRILCSLISITGEFRPQLMNAVEFLSCFV